MARPLSPSGFSLIELCLLLVLFALLSALAVPSFGKYLNTSRARGTLDRLAGDIFLARALAARAGESHHLQFHPASGCAEYYEVVGVGGVVARRVATAPDDTGVCLRSNVSRAMHLNSRGMLGGSPRKLFAESGGVVDSATISIVGRVLRWK